MPCRKITGKGSYTARPDIYMHYAAELEAIALLDREYYLNPSPNLAQRAEYYNRQEYLEQIRQRLYSELSLTHHKQHNIAVTRRKQMGKIVNKRVSIVRRTAKSSANKWRKKI